MLGLRKEVSILSCIGHYQRHRLKYLIHPVLTKGKVKRGKAIKLSRLKNLTKGIRLVPSGEERRRNGCFCRLESGVYIQIQNSGRLLQSVNQVDERPLTNNASRLILPTCHSATWTNFL